MQNKRYKNILNSSRGFSLLEVLLGITVFMIGMLGVTALNISSLKSNTFSGNMSEAVIIAGDKLEKLMAIDFEDGDLAAGDHSESYVAKNNLTYTVSWNVVADEPLPEKTKTVNVAVAWDIKGITRTMSMKTIILDHN
jgi:type IV pilus assembly protein PilV